MTATLFIVLVTLAVSLVAFSKPTWTANLMFDTDAIRFRKEYHRFLSSALVHGSIFHLLFNVYAVFLFGHLLEGTLGLGGLNMAMLYLASIAGGDALSWYKHRQTSYRSLGASGGALGLIFSVIQIAPNAISIWFIPAWLFGLLFVAYSVWAARSGQGNIGHYAHLGGACTGFLLTALFYKGAVAANPWVFVLLLLLFGGAGWMLFSGPLSWKEKRGYKQAVKAQKNSARDKERLDQLLDKVASEGIHSLSKSERTFLEAQSKQRRGGR